MSTALLIIDVQNAVLIDDALVMSDARREQINAVFDQTVDRLRVLQEKARAKGVAVIIVQHDGGAGDLLERGTRGWEIRAELAPQDGDIVVEKKNADSFFNTTLGDVLAARGITRLVTGGCMTQYCVDTTIRRAISLGYDVTLIGDGHTTTDSQSLKFEDIVRHHNETLNHFRAGNACVRVVKTQDITF
ncbi:cysteine hydrolase [Thalassospira sp. NFXS8]|uniref:cysteine hydrolase family protein n=1 Tax=Thalassospira sp. NFXS8 TaxID=2819093 RepID=UPI0032DF7B0B